MRYAPVLPVAIPLIAAALLAALSKAISQAASLIIAIAATLGAMGACVLLAGASRSESIVYWFGGWRPHAGVALGISFVIDPLGAGMAGFAGILTLAALAFSAKYFDTAENHLHALILAFLAAMCGFTLTGDMFNLFVFFELMSAAAFALCAHKTEDPGSLQGALNFAVTNTIGAYFILTGIALLYARIGALNMAQIGQTLGREHPNKLVFVAFAFVVCGYLIKGALVPFHFWLADAHAVAPTPICVLFSGVMVELGLYAVFRVYWAVFDPVFHIHIAGLRALFLSVGALTAVLAGVMCYSQRNIKRLLAYSTISHMGLMTIGAGLFDPVALSGAAIYVLGHGLVKAALFLCSGILLHRFGTVDELELHGVGKPLKWTAAVFVLGGIALAGTPFSGISAGDASLHSAAEHLGYHWVRWISLFAGTMTSAAVLRVAGRVFWGWGPARERASGAAPKSDEKRETQSGHKTIPSSMFLPAAVLLLAGLFLGMMPALPQSTLKAAAQFTNSSAYDARVLGGVSIAIPGPAMPETNVTFSLIAVGLAILIPAAQLFSRQARVLSKAIGPAMKWLHALHSGHVGDYVAFLTFGVAVFALACVFILQ
ncbi:MAG TPA: proton-conducting transporter membrane subunit [Bryobacteraceae bacterium]|nr:proton-conducting transporter membrane subunit [Bryobacteraceae bacterium]